MTLQLYSFPPSQGTRAIQALLIINQIPYETVFIDLKQGDHKKPEFLKINPSGQVPAIKDGDFTLAECHAILRYLCNTLEIPEYWYPADSKVRAKVDWYLDWHHFNIRPITWWVKAVLAEWEGKEPPFDKAKEESIFRPALERIEKELLSKNPYLFTANQPTIADLSAHSEISQLEPFGYDLGKFPKLKEWLNRMLKLDGVQEALKPLTEVVEKFKKNEKK